MLKFTATLKSRSENAFKLKMTYRAVLVSQQSRRSDSARALSLHSCFASLCVALKLSSLLQGNVGAERLGRARPPILGDSLTEQA